MTPTPRPQSSLTFTSFTPRPRVTGPRSRSASRSGQATPRTHWGAGAGGDRSMSHSIIWCRTQQMTRCRRHQSGPPSVLLTRNKHLRVAGISASLSTWVTSSKKTYQSSNWKYLETELCEDYFWEASFLVQENVTGLHSPKVLWPESAYVVQSW